MKQLNIYAMPFLTGIPMKIVVNGHVLGQEDLHKTMGQIMKECSSEKIIYVDGEIYFPTDRVCLLGHYWGKKILARMQL